MNLPHGSMSQEALLALAAVITLAGTVLCWSAPRHRMSMEEHAKDGKISAEAARKRIQFRTWCGPVVTVVGCVLLIVAALK